MTKIINFNSSDGTVNFAYKWEAEHPKAVLQIAHGAVEHAKRYDDFAKTMADEGISVYANDIRGQGKTAGRIENIGYLSDSSGGFLLAVEELHKLTQIIKEENPGLPVFLLGHSMGSLMSRAYASKYGSELAGLILTGTGRVNPVLIVIVRLLAKIQMLLFGRRKKSRLMHALIFGTLNKPFKGDKGCEFISADQDVIDKYVADEMCGNTITAEFAYELLGGTRLAAKKETFAAIPMKLPVLIASGEFDTMGGNKLSAVKKDVKDFKDHEDITFKVYEGMRHEILNEKDKRKVYNDIISWIDKRIKTV